MFTVSRLGGDEFTVIAEGVASPEDAAVIARRILDAIEQPYAWDGQELHVSASIGISMYPSDDTDLDGLIRHTDMAMYRSKAMGRGVYSFYSDELSAEVAARLSLENNLRRGLERNEFVLHYQPKATLAHRRDHRRRSADPLALPGSRHRCRPTASSACWKTAA